MDLEKFYLRVKEFAGFSNKCDAVQGSRQLIEGGTRINPLTSQHPLMPPYFSKGKKIEKRRKIQLFLKKPHTKKNK